VLRLLGKLYRLEFPLSASCSPLVSVPQRFSKKGLNLFLYSSVCLIASSVVDEDSVDVDVGFLCLSLNGRMVGSIPPKPTWPPSCPNLFAQKAGRFLDLILLPKFPGRSEGKSVPKPLYFLNLGLFLNG